MSATLKSPAEIAERLGLAAASRVLLVDAPPGIAAAVSPADSSGPEIEAVEGGSIRAVKGTFDGILVWRESRIGSRAVFEQALRRLAPGGPLWVVIAMKKVIGPETPAVHRLERPDLVKAFAQAEMICDREARLSAWHVGYRFVRRKA